MTDLHQLLINRRSIRRYTPQPIDPDQVRLILEAALMAPTSKNSRAWQFIAVENP
ncbi:MAG: nitroreductase family protein, partial [Muribaculaceae bacterium]|nr:nitroreductase family protein [Muribaculaceae bacterium]